MLKKKVWNEWATRTEQTVSVDDLVARSRELGEQGFHKGIMAPANDPEFMRLIANAPKDWGTEAHRIRVAMMKAWSDAWTDENLKEGARFGERRQKHEITSTYIHVHPSDTDSAVDVIRAVVGVSPQVKRGVDVHFGPGPQLGDVDELVVSAVVGKLAKQALRQAGIELWE